MLPLLVSAISLKIHTSQASLDCEYIRDFEYGIPGSTDTFSVEGVYPLNKCKQTYGGSNEYKSEYYSCDDQGNVTIYTYDGPNCMGSITANYSLTYAKEYSCNGGECTGLYSYGQEIRQTDPSTSTCYTESNPETKTINYGITNICIPIETGSYVEICNETENSYTQFIFSTPNCSGDPLFDFGGIPGECYDLVVVQGDWGYVEWVNCDGGIPTFDPTMDPTHDPFEPMMDGMTSTDMMDTESTMMESIKKEDPSNMNNGVMNKCLLIAWFVAIVLLLSFN